MNGVNTYRFDPKTVQSASMFDQDFKQENIDKLKNDLLSTYRGKTFLTQQLFEEDQKTGRLHSYTHYLVALRQLFDDGKLSVQYTDGKNHKASVLISSSCNITFKQ